MLTAAAKPEIICIVMPTAINGNYGHQRCIHTHMWQSVVDSVIAADTAASPRAG